MPYPLQLQHFTFSETSIDIYVPDAAFVQQQYLQQQAIDAAAIFPYWAKIWPAAYAMSEFLTVHPHYLKNKKVLELACGLALPSLIAAKYANRVCSSDCAADAVEIVQQSVEYNGFQNISTAMLNWEQLPPGINADILLLSDINYEPAKFNALYNMLSAFLNNGTTIILSTPQRLMAKPFIERLLPYVIQQEDTVVQQNMDEVALPATVFVLSICN
jgi:methyltransferase-like protein 23